MQDKYESARHMNQGRRTPMLVRYVAGIALALGIVFLNSGCSPSDQPKAEKNVAQPLLFSEPFSYPADASLSGKNGGTGFSGPWKEGGFNSANKGPHMINAISLKYANLATSGGSCAVNVGEGIVGMERSLAASKEFGKSGSVRYVSVAMKPEGKINAGPENGFFGLVLRAPEGELFFGKPGARAVEQWVMESRGGMGQVATGVPVVLNETTLLVLKIEYKEGPDRLTLYVNPKPGSSEPPTGAVKYDTDLGATDSIVVYSTGEFSIDELRGGDSFQAVTPTE